VANTRYPRLRTRAAFDPELSDRYAAADIFCMPSRAELECIAALEAMSFELPILAPRGSALDETGGAVWLYEDAHSERELADAITTLIAEPRHTLTLQEHARRVAQDRSLETIAVRWTQIYSRLRDKGEGSHLAAALADLPYEPAVVEDAIGRFVA